MQRAFFKTDEELVKYFSELGAKDTDQLAVYCGSGNAAAHDLAAMYAVGINGALTSVLGQLGLETPLDRWRRGPNPD